MASIINDVYQSGARFVLQRDTGSFYLDKLDLITADLLGLIELHKLDIYIAIGGVLGDIPDDPGDDDGSDGGIDLNIPGLPDKLRSLGVEVLPSDEVTIETLNRHYFHFSEKFEALADAIEGVDNG